MTGQIDFLIIGAEKSGTTWLADNLRRHPQVFIPAEKELFYFNERFFESPELPNFNATRPLAWYLEFFESASPGQVKGEASPAYLWDEGAPRRIHAFDARLRLIAVLRNPVERAFSQYLYYLQRGLLAGQTFEQALETRPDLLSRGLYAQQLARYFDLFPAGQIRIGYFDDLKTDPGRFLAGFQAFLGVADYAPDHLDQPANVTGVPRYALLNRAIAAVRYPLRKYNPGWLIRFFRWSGLARLQERVRLANTRPMAERPEMGKETGERLRDFFYDDVVSLQALTGRDLSYWLE